MAGTRCGYGTYVWANGESYKGHWKDDMMNGLGQFMLLDGNIVEGEFRDDVKL